MRNCIVIFVVILQLSAMAHAPEKAPKKNAKPKPTYEKPMPINTHVWTVSAQRASCVGVGEMHCLMVRQANEKNFQLFYDNIEGFEYTEGYEYVIWVRKELKSPPIPADASIYKYVLVKIVSKTPVNSQNDNTLNNENASTTDTTTIVVHEKKAPCEGNNNAMCLQIKKAGASNFDVFFQNISGFTFKDGVRQTILVSVRKAENPMVKQVQPIYTLIKVLKSEIIDK